MQERIIWKEWLDDEIYSESWTGEENRPTVKKKAMRSTEKIRIGRKVFIDSEHELFLNAISIDSLSYRPSESPTTSEVFSKFPDELDIIGAFQDLPANMQSLFNNVITDLMDLETWNVLIGCLPEWIRTGTNNDVVNISEKNHSVAFAEIDKTDEIKLCENSRCGVIEDFVNQLKGTLQTVLLKMKRQEPLKIPEETSPTSSWKHIRGPPMSLKEDEERDPVRSVLIQLLNFPIDSDEITTARSGSQKNSRKFDLEKNGRYPYQSKYCRFEMLISTTYIFLIKAAGSMLAIYANISNDIDSVILIEPTDCLSPHRLHPLVVLVDGGNQSERLKIKPGRRVYHILNETSTAVSLTLFTAYTNHNQAEIMIGPMESFLSKSIKEPSKMYKSGGILFEHFCKLLRSYAEGEKNSKSTVENAKNAFGELVDDLFPLADHSSAEKVVCEQIRNLLTRNFKSKDDTEVEDITCAGNFLTSSQENESDEVESQEPALDVEKSLKGMKLLLECSKSISNCDKILLMKCILGELNYPHSDDDYCDTLFVCNVAEIHPFEIAFKSVGCITTAPGNYIRKNIQKFSLLPMFCYHIHVNDRVARLRNHLENRADISGRIIFHDNDLGNEVVVIDNKYVILNPNENGYDVFCYAVMEKDVERSGCLTYATFGESRPNLEYSEINSKFVFWEAVGVLVPTEDNRLFRFLLYVAQRRIINIVFQTSDGSTPVKIILRNSDGTPIATSREEEDTVGFQVISAVLLGHTADASQSISSETMKGNKSNNTESTTKTPKSERQYLLEGYVKMEELKFTDNEQGLIEKIREQRKYELSANFEETLSDSENLEKNSTQSRRKAFKKIKNQENSTLPSWNLKIYFEESDANSITLKPYGPTPSDLRDRKRSWLVLNPREKLAEAINIREEFLQSENAKMPNEEMFKNELYEPGIQEICEDAYMEIQEAFSFNANGKYLHNDETRIHDEIKAFTELAIKIQMNKNIY
nr:calpain 7 protein [Hymenolepis microstoma]